MEHNLPDLYHHVDSMAIYKNGLGEDYFQETLYDVWENCVIESFKSIYNSVSKTVILNIIFGLVTVFGLPEILFHLLSALGGAYLLITTVQSTVGLAVVFVSFSLFYLVIFSQSIRKAKQDSLSKQNNSTVFCIASVIQYGLIVIFVSFEYILLEREVWLEIRGIMMVFSMKLISLVADLHLSTLPSFPEYCGYMFCCGNLLFGPWISFEHYILLVKFPTKKNLYWIYGIIKALLISFIFLSVSNCWTSYFISDEWNSLIVGYKEALSFRASHYFVCYLSEALMLSAGWKDINYHFDEEYWTFSVTNFLKIEFPTSLAAVVVSWNKPMHEFLKKYIYRKWLPLGKFQAVLLTFVISSLFHGLELKVSTVLISLGIFSYFQILVREHLAQVFDICVKIHPCKSCQHTLRRDSIVCKVALLIFSMFTVLHLIYLGVLMDQSTDEVGIYHKWSNLYFFSFWIMFLNFLIVK